MSNNQDGESNFLNTGHINQSQIYVGTTVARHETEVRNALNLEIPYVTGGRLKAAGWLSLVAAVTAWLANIATVAMSFGAKPIPIVQAIAPHIPVLLPFIFFGVGVFAVALGRALRTKAIVQMGRFSVEDGADGIRITTKDGDCPECGHKVILTTVPGGGDYPFFRCTRNPRHEFPFDY